MAYYGEITDIPNCSHGIAADTICEQCDLISKCLSYLSKQGCVLWGQFWDISDELEIEGAARWLADVIDQVKQEPTPYAMVDLRQDRSNDDSRNNSQDQ